MERNHSKSLPGFFDGFLRGPSSFRDALANASWMFFDRVFRVGVTFIVGALFARSVGPQQFGVFSFSTAFVTFFSTAAALGLDHIVIRALVTDDQARGEVLGTAFVLRLISGMFTVAATIVIISLLRPGDSLSFWLVAIMASGSLFQAADIVELWYRSQLLSRHVVWARAMAFLPSLALRVAVITTGAGALAFAGANLVETLLGSVALLLIYRQSGRARVSWTVRRSRAVSLLRDSWPMLVSSVAVLIYMRIDLFMLGEMVGNETLGIYSAATKFAEAAYLVPTVLISSFGPVLMKTRAEDYGAYLRQYQKVLRLFAVLGLSAAVTLYLVAPIAIELLFGERYLAAVPVLKLLAWACPFVFLGMGGSPFYVAENLSHLVLRRTVVGAITNVLLNLLLIPKMGMAGAALATISAQAFASLFMDGISPESRKLFRMKLRAVFWIP